MLLKQKLDNHTESDGASQIWRPDSNDISLTHIFILDFDFCILPMALQKSVKVKSSQKEKGPVVTVKLASKLIRLSIFIQF